MTRSTRARRVRAAVAAVVLAVTVVGGAPPASAGPRSDAAYAVALANGLREGNGVAPLAVDRHLAAVAAYWAAELAWNGDLAHNPTLTYQVGGWWVLGENVGYGGSVEAVHSAWLDSWSHYLNLVEPEYTHIGVGVAYDDYGGLYIVEVFAGF